MPAWARTAGGAFAPAAADGERAAPRDLRPWLAAVFGLIHGFGFASVLKEFGLPHAALGWSLFSFNLGVEIGQLPSSCCRGAALLAMVRRRSALAGPAGGAGRLGRR